MENNQMPSGQDIHTEFTRFVLPFQWHALVCPEAPSAEGFRRIVPTDPEKLTPDDWLTLPKLQSLQQSYFTHEVRSTVYERAGWFRLKKQGAEYLLGKFRIRAAGLVLFEAYRAGGKEPEVTPGDWKQGLLIIQAEPADAGKLPSFAEWLEFNENFRYVLSPWPQKENHLTKWFNKLAGLPPGSEHAAGIAGRWLKSLQEPVHLGDELWIRLGEPDDMAEMPTDHFPYAESRAYVWSALRQSWEDQSGLCQPAMSAEDVLPEACGAWVKALNVDGPPWNLTDMSAASPFDRAWAQNRTYWRWASEGTLYGFTPHSGVMLTAANPDPHKAWVLPNNINNFKWSHFTMALLAIVIRQRMAALRVRLTRLTHADTNSADGNRSVQREVGDILEEMLRFTNLYWFTHVSNQQQAQEMYPLMRDAMELNEHYRDLRRDIEATENWLRARQAAEQADIQMQLAKQAAAQSQTQTQLAERAAEQSLTQTQLAKQAAEQAQIQMRFTWIAGVGLIFSIAATILAITDLVKASWVSASAVVIIGLSLLGAALRKWIRPWIHSKCEEWCGSCDCQKRSAERSRPHD